MIGYYLPPDKLQESSAATRKPHDAEAVLFGLMFASQTTITKQNTLCLKADLNVLRCFTTNLITILQRHDIFFVNFAAFPVSMTLNLA